MKMGNTWRIFEGSDASLEEGVSYDNWANIDTEGESAPDPKWDHCFDALLDLRKDPSHRKEDLGVPPSRNAVDATMHWLARVRNQFPATPPTSVHLEPAGGLIVQWVSRDRSGEETIAELTVYNEETAETTWYRAGKVVRIDDVPFYPPDFRWG